MVLCSLSSSASAPSPVIPTRRMLRRGQEDPALGEALQATRWLLFLERHHDRLVLSGIDLSVGVAPAGDLLHCLRRR